ncbi:site-specific integrase [Microlunatus elymi]|uniref:Site-specific integrase n=1 Tax=Microlunatus elymi TaxID=2596828 RepID=A0A516PUU6_9ACTN|nr:site-specific integrase [Microlunatus elymi]QDP94966.1 site-specific integrase [Microlunatus elymi]
MGRNPNNTWSIYLGADGDWHGRVSVGIRDDGSPDRRHVRGRSKEAVMDKVRELTKARDAGHVPKAGRRWTVADWLTHWLELISRPNVRQRSYEAYRTAVNTHLIPALGKQRLDRLQPEHLERLYRRIVDGGASPGTAHQVHRTVRTALGEAVRRGYVSRNVATLAKAPRVKVEPITPYSIPEVKSILAEAGRSRNSARWAIALALGMRQGEVLGLRWESDVDLDTGTLRVRKSRQRPKYEHGCGETCGKTPGRCPRRRRINDDVDETKSEAGRRIIGLPDDLIAMLKIHREEQHAERRLARQLWHETGFVVTSPFGEPINPNTDYHAWKALLKRAGVRDGRLHDARHTAATVLLVLGVPERTTMALMGWSSTSMAARYQHVTDPIRRDVAERVGGLFWADDVDN